MIIDCHCHAGSGDGLTGPWDTRAPLQDYLRRAAVAGIRRTVLFSAFHSNYAVANQQVARIVASRPDRFYGFAFIHAERDRGHVHKGTSKNLGLIKLSSIKSIYYMCRSTVFRGFSRCP